MSNKTQTSEIDFAGSTATNQIANDFWKDEKGISIPATRITKSERTREKQSHLAYKNALRLNADLKAFKEKLRLICQQVFAEGMNELKQNDKENKGGFTWFNFDRSLKVMVSVNERIDFDDITIKAAKECLDAFLAEQLNDKENFIRELINSAFSNTKGMLDSKRIMSLLGYRSKIKAAKFQEALDLIEKSIRRPDSKQYIRIFYRDGNGEYIPIDLNFSSI